MNTTSRMLIGCVATGWCLLNQTAWAGPHSGAVGSLIGASAVTQTGASNSDEAQKQCLDLISRARQAMNEGKWETADSLLSRAEAMQVDFGLFHLGDTPKKARKDFEKLHAPKKPSQQFLGGLGKKQDKIPADPFAKAAAAKPVAASSGPAGVYLAKGRNELAHGNTTGASYWYQKAASEKATFGPSDDNPDKLRADIVAAGGNVNVTAAPPAAATAGNAALAPPPDHDDLGAAFRSRPATSAAPGARAQSDKLLIQARKALAVGDTRRASHFVEQAKALAVSYDLRDDTPSKVESCINRSIELSKVPNKNTEAYQRQNAALLLEQGEALVSCGELDEAERIARDVQRLPVSYTPYEAQPRQLLDRIALARRGAAAPRAGIELLPPVDGARPLAGPAGQTGAMPIGGPSQVITAGGANPIDSVGQPGQASQALYDRARDPTYNMPVRAQEAVPPGAARPEAGGNADGMKLFADGEEALRAHDVDQAVTLFRQAYDRRADLDPATQQRLQDHLQLLSQNAIQRRPQDGAMLDQATLQQQLVARQASAELARQEKVAHDLRESDPYKAMEVLKTARGTVEKLNIDGPSREVLLRRVDREANDLQQYITSNKARIDLQLRNAAVRAEVDHGRVSKVEVQEKLALMVNDFNKLMDEHRYAEAEVLAKKAQEMMPSEPVTLQLRKQVAFVREFNNQMGIKEAKEQGFLDQMASVDKSSIPFDDSKPYQFGDKKHWNELTKTRFQALRDRQTHRGERELEIEQKLKTPVSLRYHDAPLSEVIEHLGKLAQVNMHIDPRGLQEEGVASDTPVTIDLSQEISLKSALRLILEPLHLSYVIKDEVLKITSEQLRDNLIYPVSYNVADLVIPIPNFVPTSESGLAGAIANAYRTVGVGGGTTFGGPGSIALANNGHGMVDAKTLAQMGGNAPPGVGSIGSGQTQTGMPQNIPFGPGGLGGGVQPDFDSLIELITATIKPTSWDTVGGPGAIKQFETNLSLVISQTQEVHEEIADLLEQLRRLQDLQVTIEVRFITLNDSFFERIGIDFDFDVNDKADAPFQIFGQRDPAFTPFPAGTTTNPPRDVQDRDSGPSVTVGQSAPGVFSSDLDIPFRQGSFGLAVPQFGGFDAAAGASMGFAILSDIEAFFFIEAAQGDRRSNVLQAPKVTLFNGQSATVADISSSPFVISVIPVVGDFAAAQQPVIVVLNEGTSLNVQAVVSNDRRFVRLTVVPFFSHIGKVDTFTFEGSSTTTEDTSSTGKETDTDGRKKTKTTASTGTTVQLPTFSSVSVSTTVSVPDGGTVLLGGVKRLSEGRNEFGVPLLNKLPYINRLFQNSGVGRETQSLMMMVTPRIIIQEEEEQLLGIQQPAP